MHYKTSAVALLGIKPDFTSVSSRPLGVSFAKTTSTR
jgi:hypothetical protein